ncbi:glucose PTS transporter subunit IIA [uncultured Anaerococcus sp.]|uniref:PTS sugar transporter subunit IIA n=1 Tax=uncultured Anaerococcus sp. TaxID=293428 RepID=UPI0025E7D19B|nr:glucose PTS transporter subunit IIA [uncultured Anaerococcus sp.]
MADYDNATFYAPMTGELLDIGECVDPIFSQNIVGAGVLLTPSLPKVYSPCAGKVSILANGRHGITIKNSDGLQVLIHVGIDTVEMDGDGFISHKKVGDEVKPGDLLLEFDLEKIKTSGKSLQSPVVITNPSVKKLDILAKGQVNHGDELFRIIESK